MIRDQAKVYFMCGKMAAGKSTHAKALAKVKGAVLFAQDELLDTLYPGEILGIDDFEKYSARVLEVVSPYIREFLTRGISVVLDFPGNTMAQRAWFRRLIEAADVGHELHYIEATDDLCKRQLRQRSSALPAGAPWTTEAEFNAVTAFFEAPMEHENFTVIRHPRT